MEELKALRMVWWSETAELFFSFSSERQKDYRKKYSGKKKRRDVKEEREMGGNERDHILCIVNTVD